MGILKQVTPKKKNISGTKKNGTGASDSGAPAIPSANELQGAVVGSPGAARSGGDEDAILNIYEIPKYCTDGSVYGDHFDGEMAAVHCV